MENPSQAAATDSSPDKTKEGEESLWMVIRTDADREQDKFVVIKEDDVQPGLFADGGSPENQKRVVFYRNDKKMEGTIKLDKIKTLTEATETAAHCRMMYKKAQQVRVRTPSTRPQYQHYYDPSRHGYRTTTIKSTPGFSFVQRRPSQSNAGAAPRFRIPKQVVQRCSWEEKPTSKVWRFSLDFEEKNAVQDSYLINELAQIGRFFAPVVINNKNLSLMEAPNKMRGLAIKLKRLAHYIEGRRGREQKTRKLVVAESVSTDTALAQDQIPNPPQEDDVIIPLLHVVAELGDQNAFSLSDLEDNLAADEESDIAGPSRVMQSKTASKRRKVVKVDVRPLEDTDGTSWGKWALIDEYFKIRVESLKVQVTALSRVPNPKLKSGEIVKTTVARTLFFLHPVFRNEGFMKKVLLAKKDSPAKLFYNRFLGEINDHILAWVSQYFEELWPEDARKEALGEEEKNTPKKFDNTTYKNYIKTYETEASHNWRENLFRFSKANIMARLPVVLFRNWESQYDDDVFTSVADKNWISASDLAEQDLDQDEETNDTAVQEFN